MENDIILVKQLPIITEKLQEINLLIKDKADNLLSLECNENTYKDIKKERAELTKLYLELESKRIEVKKEILAPYNAFNKIYDENITDVYKTTKSQIDSKIEDVENKLIEEKTNKVKQYFDEYRKLKNVNFDFVNFESANIKVYLSATEKNLKELAKSYIDILLEDLELINTFSNKVEILEEYKKCLNVSKSVLAVAKRKREIASLENIMPNNEEMPKEENQVVLTLEFTETIESLKKLKSWLVSENFNFKQIF